MNMLIIKLKATMDTCVKEDQVDLTKIIESKHIDISAPESYVTPEYSGHHASGGQIFPVQQVVKNNKTYATPVSVNVRLRYDDNDPKNKHWNVDVYVGMHNLDLSWYDRRLGQRHPDHVHRLSDSAAVVLEWWINGAKQSTVKEKRPENQA